MTSTLARREFLRRLGATLAVGALPRCAFQGEPTGDGEGATPHAETNPIIDTHQHLWDLRKFRLPWTEGNQVLHRSFLLEDYLEASKGLGIAKTVYMEVDVEKSQKAAEAEYAIELCRRQGSVVAGAVIGGLPDSDDFKQYLARFRDRPEVKGVRKVLFEAVGSEPFFLAERFVEGIRLLGKLGLSFDLCAAAARLPDAAKLAEKCPDTAFILDHCGNPDLGAPDLSGWKRDVEALARRRNIVCKVSGFISSVGKGAPYAEGLASVVHHVRNVFGPDRLIFGSDWPVCTLRVTYAQWVEGLRAAVGDWKPEDRRKLFSENARRVYRLT